MLISKNPETLNFKAGLTSGMKKDIADCSPSKISYYLNRHSIQCDFKNDKTVAWCVLKCYELLKNFNNQFNLNLGFPKGIFVEDFNNLNIAKQGALGFTNFVPAKLYSNNDSITQEKTIFFDKLDWNKVDEISDENFEHGITTTDFFLETFLHEFTHVIHEDNLLNKKSGNNVIAFLQKMLNPQFIETFRMKYKSILKPICNYASENPLETIACDFSKRILSSIDKTGLNPQNNFIKTSPYQNFSIIKKFRMLYGKKHEESLLLNKIWTGNL